MTSSEILKYFKSNGGYARMSQLKAAGIHTRTIKDLHESGVITKVKPGLYRLSKVPPRSESGMVEVCIAMPKAVVCLTSALSFHGLTTFLPTKIAVAIPRDSKPNKIRSNPVETFYFSPAQYKAGIEQRNTRSGLIRIYSREKSICDAFRYRSKIGTDLAIESLKEYLRDPKRNVNTLMKFAEICRVKQLVSQYTRAILG
jgi:predicted transcriptional regulator of viral defense system